MSRRGIDRRQFLTLALSFLLAPPAARAADLRRGSYTVEVGILWNMLSYRVEGTLEETLDREARRYAVTLAGKGEGVAKRFESTGTLRAGRWTPARTRSRA